jgi:hypothetical protein
MVIYILMNINTISNKLNITYYNNIIEYCKKTNNKYDFFTKQLKKETDAEESYTENEKILSQGDEAEEVKEVVYSDDYLYKKPWIKLSSIHKIIKMKEFISKLLIEDIDEKDKLKNSLTKLINTKVLTKKDQVRYDPINGRVISIPILTFKNGKYLIKN